MSIGHFHSGNTLPIYSNNRRLIPLQEESANKFPPSILSPIQTGILMRDSVVGQFRDDLVRDMLGTWSSIGKIREKKRTHFNNAVAAKKKGVVNRLC